MATPENVLLQIRDIAYQTMLVIMVNCSTRSMRVLSPTFSTGEGADRASQVTCATQFVFVGLAQQS